MNDNFQDDEYSNAQTAAGLRNIERFTRRIEARYSQLKWLALKGTNDEFEHPKDPAKDIKLCFFYDPDQPHGGRPRDRRDDDDEYLGTLKFISISRQKILELHFLTVKL